MKKLGFRFWGRGSSRFMDRIRWRGTETVIGHLRTAALSYLSWFSVSLGDRKPLSVWSCWCRRPPSTPLPPPHPSRRPSSPLQLGTRPTRAIWGSIARTDVVRRGASWKTLNGQQCQSIPPGIHRKEAHKVHPPGPTPDFPRGTRK